ncbi:MAG: hypothetical protein HYV27_00090 [Candidatus Hydrogenedentes bacterium]|nr:hypothetical protein [Candidatus Hydrogenedentota bacterium]
MAALRPWTLLAALCCAWCVFAGAAPSDPVKAPNFTLLDLEGRSFALYRATGTPALVFLGLHSGDPDAEALLKQAAEQWPAFNAETRAIVLACSPHDATRAALSPSFLSFHHRYTVLHDPAGIIARALGLSQSGAWRRIETHGFTMEAPSRLDPDRPAAPALTPELPSVTYAGEAGAILARRCAGCHRDGANAPFAMDGYRSVLGWSAMMGEVVRTRRMPPWDADPEYGRFLHDAGLTPLERLALLQWIDSGAPQGDGPDPLLGNTAAAAQAWPLGEPDLVLRLPEMQMIPAEGFVKYRYLDIGLPPSDRDRWLRATHVRPTNPRAVHHALVFVREVGTRIDPQGEFMTSYLPGMGPQRYPEGTGKRIPAGAQLIVQMHYTAMGKPDHDQTEVGLYFLPGPPARELRRMAAFSRDFEVPPMMEDFAIVSTLTMGEDRYLYSMHPHMHYRGKWMRYTARFPNGQEEILLNVPHYNFYWQHSYELEAPRLLPKGTVIEVRGAFDNSLDNPLNPNPMATLRWGEDSDQEMFAGAMTYASGE